MKLTKSKLKQIIKEELNKVLKEYYDEFDSHSDAEHREKWEAMSGGEAKEEKLRAVLLDKMPELENQMSDDKLGRLVSTILNHSRKDPFDKDDLEELIDMAYTLAWETSDHSPDSWKTQLETYF
tara:strand:- start:28 stop:399 length:372 start_codon:yes stop_codon:yes gene_type:complete